MAMSFFSAKSMVWKISISGTPYFLAATWNLAKFFKNMSTSGMFGWACKTAKLYDTLVKFFFSYLALKLDPFSKRKINNSVNKLD